MEVEWLILADAAQVVGNKLYLLGGGWDRLMVNSGFPVNQSIGIAVSFRVPWNETNEQHSFEVEVASEDGATIQKVGGGLEVGRPAGIPPGQEQRVQVAANAVLRLNSPGTYVIIARVDGTEGRRIAFNVVPGALLPRNQGGRQQG